MRRYVDWAGCESVLEIAPARSSRVAYGALGVRCISGDYARGDVDVRLDVRALPFADDTFDVVVMSHVLEHVDDDRAAVAEVARVLKPSGQFFVAVPVVAEETVEYPEPNPLEDFHWRAPGLTYYTDRLNTVFEQVSVYGSSDCDPRSQPFHLEDRTVFPNEVAPLRPAQEGGSHPEICAVASRPVAVRP